MMTNYQLAQMTTEAMQEQAPAALASLVDQNQLVPFLMKKIQAFLLEFVRRMEGQPPAAELTIAESLYPMLTDYPPEKVKIPLTSIQESKLREQIFQFEDQMNSEISQADRSEPTYA